MFIFRQGGREGCTTARYCYSEGTFLLLQNLANIVQNLRKLNPFDARRWENTGIWREKIGSWLRFDKNVSFTPERCHRFFQKIVLVKDCRV
jgi:hypothetical protein